MGAQKKCVMVVCPKGSHACPVELPQAPRSGFQRAFRFTLHAHPRYVSFHSGKFPKNERILTYSLLLCEFSTV